MEGKKGNKINNVRKVLVIGSGPIKIAEAAEFDYSANQALKALREEGIKTIILSSNIATVQTDKSIADKVYILPVTYEFARSIIKKERPDGIMVGFGGQSALNVGIDLYRNGVLKKYSVRVLGTPIAGIESALSRKQFRQLMENSKISVPRSIAIHSTGEALKAASSIGYPVMLRVSFNLGGRGSFIAHSREELLENIGRAFAQSRTGEVLIERYLEGWKEVEYEVVRDIEGNSIAPACLENIDPMGVHTGDSIVVTPAQTLDNFEYQRMRSAAIKVAESIGLVGECNVQFALDPKSSKFFVIETNPRMSRSSALASKATGYPLAYISAKLSLGKMLYELENSISRATSAFFEPSLDYVTIKMPYWDFVKFDMRESLGTEMRSIGEVMAIGRNIEEAFMKGIKMLGLEHAFGQASTGRIGRNAAINSLRERRPYWFLDILRASSVLSPKEMSVITGVDEFFVNKIVALKNGFNGRMHVKQIDTLAGEYPANMNYLYTTKLASSDDLEFEKERSKSKLLIIGAGRFRIGVSVEFDYSAVLLAKSARRNFDQVIMLNHNPETVSTDWDIADKLYFDMIDADTIEELNKKEHFSHVAVFAAGQVGNDIAVELESKGMRLLGTKAQNIDKAENRALFSEQLSKLHILQPEWASAESLKGIREFIDAHGFPVLVRPSHVLSGTSMKIAWNEKELLEFIKSVPYLSRKYPVVISKFMADAVEAEVDAVGDGNNAIGIAIEHIEEAGVHSGDSTMITPVKSGYATKMKDVALKLVKALEIKGPFNLQFIVKDGNVYVIELNLRASRSMPFSSKSVGVNLIGKALEGSIGAFSHKGFYEPRHTYFAAKSPQFSWLQMRSAYPTLGPEMKSTGESGAFGGTREEALLKSWLGAQPNAIPKKNGKILIYGKSKEVLEDAAAKLSRDFDIMTIGGAYAINARKLSINSALEAIDRLSLVITNGSIKNFDYKIRRKAVDSNIPIILNGRLGSALAGAISKYTMEGISKRV
ncbi:MAG: carbamoyl-phosphate synthase large subunit [Candidatus Marsarchaeota archaeon]|nr:carbamoyl-phosphate synthase large subunit [Candidatus Marsarchaeota archaeon]MCL5418406.1 carbamoyl-phosphate synthase large subunit [Candidatus Marsarchaeota archaeon]